MASASIKSGICGYCEADIHGSEDDPTIMEAVPEAIFQQGLDKLNAGGRDARVLCLAVFALSDILEFLPDEPVPLFIAGPEVYIGSPIINGEFIQDLALQTGANLDLANTY